MNKVLTYYSVSAAQVDGLKLALKKTGLVTMSPIVGPDGLAWSGTISGKTTFGNINATYNYNKPSGQLVVTIEEHPILVTIETIDAHLRDSLATLALAIEEAPKHSAVSATGSTESTLPPSNPAKAAKGQKVTDAVKE